MKSAPSGGLLDNPQDVTFFDFHLIDPKDEPFARFRFHYRSLVNLHELNLIPSDDSSIYNTFSSSTFTESIDLAPDASNDETPCENTLARPPAFRVDPDESVFDDNSSSSEDQLGPAEGDKPWKEKVYVLRTPPQLRPGSGTSHHLPQPSKTLRDGSTNGLPAAYLQRPLPDRPLPDLPIGVPNEICGPSRKTSTASIATSLLSYVKDSSFLDESVEYGHAQEVPVYKAKSDPLPAHDQDQHDPDDLSVGSPSARDFETSFPKASKSVLNVGEEYIDFSRFPHLQLDEYEWIRRSPSPKTSPRRVLSPRLGRLWDTLRRNRSRSPLRQPPREGPVRNCSTPHLPGQGGIEQYGNWI